MHGLISGMSAKFRVALMLLLLAVCLMFLVAGHSDYFTKILFTLISAMAIGGAVKLSIPAKVRMIWIKNVSLIVASSFVSGIVFFQEYLQAYIIQIFGQQFPTLNDSGPSDIVLVGLTIFLFGVICIVNRWNGDELTSKRRKSVLDKQDNQQDREELIRDLSTYIENLDEELNWNHEKFVELEADVDVVLKSGRRRSQGSVTQAIKKNHKSELFLVLGDPGSGKSVALRSLVRTLLKEARDGGHIPIYINLREWPLTVESFSSNSTIDSNAFHDYVLGYLESQLSVTSFDFFKENFKTLQSEGQIFFILDSFDEIPAVLDIHEGSRTIKELSELLYRYILSGHNARGLIASRYFRRPTPRHERCLLEIRPFNEARIAELIDKLAVFPEALKIKVFSESAHLGALARNPFLLSLILDYEKFQTSQIPDSQAELFGRYISQVIGKVKADLSTESISDNDLRRICIQIANYMFDHSSLGLEAPTADLESICKTANLKNVLETFRDFRFFRISQSGNLSFAHRRFQEYFLILRFNEGAVDLPLEAITKDNRWRDAMVLYSEIAPYSTTNSGPGNAEEIAEFCWNEMQVLFEQDPLLDPPRYLKGLNALRFLVEAFRSRPEVIQKFNDIFSIEISSAIDWKSGQNIDLLKARYAVECVPFLTFPWSGKVLISALEMSSSLLSQLAFRACRYFGKVPKNILLSLEDYVLGLTSVEFSEQRRDIKIALSYGDQFESLLKCFRIKRVHMLILQSAFWVYLIFVPILWALFFLFSILEIGSKRVFSKEEYREEIQKKYSRYGYLDSFFEIFTVVQSNFSRFFFFSQISLGIIWLHTIVAIDVIELVSGVDNERAYFYSILMMSFVSAVFLLSLFAMKKPKRKKNHIQNWFRKIRYVIYKIQRKKGTSKIAFQRILSVLSSGGEFVVGLGFLLLSVVVLAAFNLLDVTVMIFLMIFGFSLFSVAFRCLLLTVRGIYKVYCHAKTLQKDRKLYRLHVRTFSPNRELVAKTFGEFSSVKYRGKYVQWLEESDLGDEDLKQLRNPENLWPKGKRPNINNDESSVRLAMLDAKWLNLDRY